MSLRTPQGCEAISCYALRFASLRSHDNFCWHIQANTVLKSELTNFSGREHIIIGMRIDTYILHEIWQTMNSRIITGYLSVVGLSVFLHAMKPEAAYFSLLPLLMLIFPFAVGHRVKLTFSLQDFSLGLVVSLVLLLPYYLLFGGRGRQSRHMLLYFRFSLSLSPRNFFSGFPARLDRKGLRAVFLISLLFLFAISRGNFLGRMDCAPQFFPSLIMAGSIWRRVTYFPELYSISWQILCINSRVQGFKGSRIQVNYLTPKIHKI